MATIAKNIKNKSGLMLALLFMLIIGAGTIMAMKAPDKAKISTEKKKNATAKKHHRFASLYRFDGSTNADITDPSKYTAITTPPSGCNGGAVYPCYLSITEDLSTWLGERDASQVVADAAATKH